ncbi:hypothetical protein [Labilibaculum euxinus]
MFLNRIFAYLLLLTFSFQSFEVVLITVNFKINQDFFASICTNKDKPEMKCNGKCHLKKQIQEHEKEESSKDKQITEKEYQLFIQSISILKNEPAILASAKQLAYIEPLHPTQHSFDIFHPPRIKFWPINYYQSQIDNSL